MNRIYHDDGLTIDYFGPKTALPREFQPWVQVFIRWKNALQSYSGATRGQDEGFAYAERPNVGFLSGAIWMEGGVALQEYKVQKQDPNDRRFHYDGRADFWVKVGTRRYSLEAKHKEVRLDTQGTMGTMLAQLEWAHSDTNRVIEDFDYRGEVAFIPLRAPSSKSEDFDSFRSTHIEEQGFEQALTSPDRRLFVVHLFPSWRETPYRWQEWSYLGITVLLGIHD